MLKTNLEGNLTLEGVQRSQSGTYGCRVEDYDAAEDAELSKTLELHVACKSRQRAGRGAPGTGRPSPSPGGSPASDPLFPLLWPLPWSRCPSPLQSPTQGSQRALSKAQT